MVATQSYLAKAALQAFAISAFYSPRKGNTRLSYLSAGSELSSSLCDELRLWRLSLKLVNGDRTE